MLLPDSTLYIDWLRAGRDPLTMLKPWLLRDEVLCCGLVRCEVLRSIVSKRVRERLTALFDLLPVVKTDEAVWDRTAHLAWTLDRRGIVLPLSDLLLAVCALLAEAILISTDRHFRRIPGLQVLSSLPAA